MRTSGILLDVYDDYNGDVIRGLFPALETVPDFVKQAHALSSEERDLLPDDAFALVLLNDGQRLRKYACTDPGNTALSVMYFMENGHKLPEEAQKVAATNLSKACTWYEIEAPVLEKIALVGWAARKAIEHPFTALNIALSGPDLKERAHTISDNNRVISAIRASEGDIIGGRPISPQEIEEAKHAEISGTALAPTSKAVVAPLPSKTTVQKSASMRPYVNVTGKEPTNVTTVKRAASYALGERYPLDSYEQVKMASSYFEEFGRRFSPEDRREYCGNLLKRAEALSINVSDTVRRYGGDTFADDIELKIACDLRKQIINDECFIAVLDGLYEKRAEIGPDMFAATLAEFDKLAGIASEYDKEIPDPYYSTFHKSAEATFSEVVGNETVTEERLRYFARASAKSIIDTFGADFLDEFQKDPVGIFKSLPRDQKVVIMRLASDSTGSGGELQY